ncbi:MAG: excinuclease ABC subunit UvrA [bacterium]
MTPIKRKNEGEESRLGEEKIVVKGARTHNLKDIDVEMPRNKMIAITGLSGSGKSSLAFDTIFAEGQRRYVESLSSYARQFLRQMQKPDVDEITGLSPAISIDQKSRSNNPRSTVATITEIYDYLRVLFARIGRPHCLICDSPINKLSLDEINNFVIEKVTTASKGARGTETDSLGSGSNFVEIFSPLVRGRKGEYYQLLYDLLGKGYSEVIVDGTRHKLREQIILQKNKKHDIDVLVDRITLSDFKEDAKSSFERLSESLEKSLEESDGLVKILFSSLTEEGRKKAEISVTKTGKEGLGEKVRSVAVDPKELKQDSEFLMSSKFACPNDGYSYPEIEPRLFSFNSPYGACPECHGLGTESFFTEKECKICNGKRLRPEALHVLIGGKNIVEVTDLAISSAQEYFIKLKLSETERNISKVVLKEIESRLEFMINVGIEYLELSRRAYTLSGGEAQRIRLASQLGSGLVGALYVLDEPTIGLHSRDNDRLIKTLLDLRDTGNTILVVEHDEDTIFSSDYIVDIGPGAGVHGGEVVVSGFLDELLTAKKNDSGSLTLDYLRGDKKIEIPDERRKKDLGKLGIRAGKIFNLKDINVDVPLGRFIAITGVSGSGKSSLMYEIIHKNLSARLERRHRSDENINCSSFTGSENVSRVILIDQSPIGRTPRSNPVTYTGAWTHIRDLFAASVEARARGWKANRFSFNVKGGRCEACQGNGEIAVEMHFLPTVYVPCEVCEGKRFTKETLEVKYKKKNIYEILKMTVEGALKFFEDIPAVEDRMKSLMDVGLGYLELGQSATTLSGGEAQRVKISSELYRAHLQKTIYLLDEPTIGLHYEDVKKLIEILQKLVDKGNSVMVIEHNMDFIKSADYVIDVGPEGGTHGGQIVAKGTPEEVANNVKSYTGKYLKKALK